MSEIPAVSSAQLAARRRQLRWQRRWRIIQISWQVFAMAGMTAGLVWVISLPDWMLRSSQQVVVEGNQSLSPDTIRGLLPIQYPQFLLTLRPETIVHHLESQAPIAEATVTRHLFPPSLTIRIQERYPVAIVFQEMAAAKPNSGKLEPTAFLDERGTIIPYENYMALRGSRPLPHLKVIGIQDQQRTEWATIYQLVSRSPVKISELDWREPGNLILRTELGAVWLGSYGSRFAQQIQTIDRMRDLSKQINLNQIEYIDLSNPDAPLLKTVGAASATREMPADSDDALMDAPVDAPMDSSVEPEQTDASPPAPTTTEETPPSASTIP